MAMALRCFGRRVTRLASAAAARSLAPAAVSAWTSPPLAPSMGVSALQTRSFAKAKKSKGKAKASAASAPVTAAVDDDDDEDVGADVGEDGGAAKALAKTKKNMQGAVVSFTRALSQMRPGHADAGIFDELHVQAYGQHVPLAQVAQVSVSGTHSLSVAVYDPALIQDIKKAIEAMNPVYSIREDVSSLEISFPKMSQETRAELLKATKKQAEQARQHVRRVRQDAMNQAKKLKETVSEDDAEQQKERIQKLTDDAVAEIAKLLTAKEKDLATV